MELVQRTIGQMLRKAAEQWPDRPALQNAQRVLTWKECVEEVELRAAELLSKNIKKGTHVGLLVPNSMEAFVMMLACWDIGAVTVLLNTSLTAEELSLLLELSEVSVLVSGGQYKQIVLMQTVEDVLAQYQRLPVIDLYAPPQAGVDHGLLEHAQALVGPEDMAAILFTSGTTSLPKAVPSTHFMRVNSARIQARDLAATEEDKFCVTIPLFHCFGLTTSVLSAVAVGGCICFPKSNRTAELMHTISTMRCTVLNCVPTLFFAMMAREDFDTYDISSLRIGYIGGSFYTPEQFARIENKFGLLLLSSLGQTEATAGLSVSYLTDSLEVRSTTVGHFMEHLEGCIMDPDGNRVPTGTQGEICIRGFCVMEGYYRSPAQTAAAIDAAGWLHTGDMGYLDEEDNIHLTGRLKDLVIRGGENIAPAEIENCFIELCPDIAQIKVVGVPDAHYGEELCACIEMKQDAHVAEEALRSRAAEYLAYYKIPKYFLFVEHIPTTPSGKIRGPEVKELCIQKLREEGKLA